MADIGPVGGDLAACLVGDLLLESFDLAAKVRDDVGVLSDVVGHVDQVLLHLGAKTTIFFWEGGSFCIYYLDHECYHCSGKHTVIIIIFISIVIVLFLLIIMIIHKDLKEACIKTMLVHAFFFLNKAI